MVTAVIGTTVAPWQLFFQQSSVVDKRITARWLRYERADTAIGTLLFAVGAVTLSAPYAIGDVAGTRHSLHRPWREARVFHGSYAALVALAAGVTLVPGVPLGIVTTGVQALGVGVGRDAIRLTAIWPALYPQVSTTAQAFLPDASPVT